MVSVIKHVGSPLRVDMTIVIAMRSVHMNVDMEISEIIAAKCYVTTLPVIGMVEIETVFLEEHVMHKISWKQREEVTVKWNISFVRLLVKTTLSVMVTAIHSVIPKNVNST